MKITKYLNSSTKRSEVSEVPGAATKFGPSYGFVPHTLTIPLPTHSQAQTRYKR